MSQEGSPGAYMGLTQGISLKSGNHPESKARPVIKLTLVERSLYARHGFLNLLHALANLVYTTAL